MRRGSFSDLTPQQQEDLLRKVREHQAPTSTPTMSTPTPDQPKENPVLPPKPADRIIIYAVKNGWMIDVDSDRLNRNYGCVSTPNFVYTTLTRLASDVMTFLRVGKPADYDFVSPTGNAPAMVDANSLARAKQNAYIDGRNSRCAEIREAEVKGYERGHHLGYQLAVSDADGQFSSLNAECESLRKQVNDAYARGKHEGEANEHGRWAEGAAVAISTVTKERDAERARIVKVWALNDDLKKKIVFLEKEGREAFRKGREDGIEFIMSLVKKARQQYETNWSEFFGGGAK